MSFLVATIAVFMRDMFYIYGVVLTLLTYATPIMYDLAIVQNETLITVMKFNPLYQYINFGRMIMLYHQIPSLGSFLACAFSSIAVLLLGVYVFRRNQDKFIYYM